MRETMPSTMATYPKNSPDCIDVTVVPPMIDAGLRTSTRGSRAARWNRASAEMPMPGQMTPPRYSPAAEIASKVVAVPKSTTITGDLAARPYDS